MQAHVRLVSDRIYRRYFGVFEDQRVGVEIESLLKYEDNCFRGLVECIKKKQVDMLVVLGFLRIKYTLN